MRFEGVAANCVIVFFESPLFNAHRKAALQLHNCVNMQGFIVTIRAILPGEELRWKYNISQGYRCLPGPTTPTRPPAPQPSKQPRSQVLGAKLTTPSLAPAARPSKQQKLDVAGASIPSAVFMCTCITKCFGICIDAPLPQDATRERKQRKVDSY
jgi:hypothetical protein